MTIEKSQENIKKAFNSVMNIVLAKNKKYGNTEIVH